MLEGAPPALLSCSADPEPPVPADTCAPRVPPVLDLLLAMALIGEVCDVAGWDTTGMGSARVNHSKVRCCAMRVSEL